MPDHDKVADLQARLEEFGLAPHPEENTFLPGRLIAHTDRSALIAAVIAALLTAFVVLYGLLMWQVPEVMVPQWDLAWTTSTLPIRLGGVGLAVLIGVPIGRDFFWRGGLAYSITSAPDDSGGALVERRSRYYRPPHQGYRLAGIVCGGALAPLILTAISTA